MVNRLGSGKAGQFVGLAVKHRKRRLIWNRQITAKHIQKQTIAETPPWTREGATSGHCRQMPGMQDCTHEPARAETAALGELYKFYTIARRP